MAKQITSDWYFQAPIKIDGSQGIEILSGTPTVTTYKLYQMNGILCWNGAAVGGSGGGSNPMTTQNQLIVGGVNGVQQALNPGLPRQLLCTEIGYAGTPVFTGSGTLNDLIIYGSYSGSQNAQYEVKIATLGSPDRYMWRKDAGSWSIEIDIQAGYGNYIDEGLYIYFTNGTGHTLDDDWVVPVYASPIVWGSIDQVLPLISYSPQRQILANDGSGAYWADPFQFSMAGQLISSEQAEGQTTTLLINPGNLGDVLTMAMGSQGNLIPTWEPNAGNLSGFLDNTLDSGSTDIVIGFFPAVSYYASITNFRIDFEYSIIVADDYETGHCTLYYDQTGAVHQNRTVDFTSFPGDSGVTFQIVHTTDGYTQQSMQLQASSTAGNQATYHISYRYFQTISTGG